MKNTFLLRNEFKQYLQDNKFPIRTISSYCSYVAGADRAFLLNKDNIVEESNLFEILKIYVESNDFINMDSVIIEIIDELSTNGIDKILNTPIGYIRNWKSGLFQYREFLYDYISLQQNNNKQEIEFQQDSETKKITIKKDDDSGTMSLDLEDSPSPIIDKNYKFSKNDLYKTFRFRIITQDRFYKEIFYPISFIKRVLYTYSENDFMDNWIKNVTDNILVHSQGSTLKLSEITELSISKNTVFAKYEKTTFAIYTKLADNKTLQPFSVDNLRKISLDHVSPLHNIMCENIENLPTFSEITTELKKHIDGTVNPKKLKNAYNIVLKNGFIKTIDIEKLKIELKLLSSISVLQLMDATQNLLKKKN